jgi:hypothetical protein
LESLSPWKESTLGMNTLMKSSSIFMLSYHSYSYSCELEYSFAHVIIMIYELVYSLYAMIMTSSSLFFIVHITCMNRGRTRVRAMVRCAFGFAHVLACQSIGLESRGDMGSFFVHGCGARVHGNCEYDGAPRLRGRRQVVTALSVPHNPPRSGIRVGVRKVYRLADQLQGSPYQPRLSSNSNNVICMIIKCSLQ